MKPLDGAELCRSLKRHGWRLLRTQGSHRIHGKEGSEPRILCRFTGIGNSRPGYSAACFAWPGSVSGTCEHWRWTVTLPGGGTWLYEYAEYPVLPKDDPNSLTKCLARIADDQNRVVEYGIDYRGILCSATWNYVSDQYGLYSYCRTDLTSDRDAQNRSHGWLANTVSKYWWRTQIGDPPSMSRVLSESTYLWSCQVECVTWFRRGFSERCSWRWASPSRPASGTLVGGAQRGVWGGPRGPWCAIAR